MIRIAAEFRYSWLEQYVSDLLILIMHSVIYHDKAKILNKTIFIDFNVLLTILSGMKKLFYATDAGYLYPKAIYRYTMSRTR